MDKRSRVSQNRLPFEYDFIVWRVMMNKIIYMIFSGQITIRIILEQ